MTEQNEMSERDHRSRRVLVTGASGVFGRQIVGRLLRRGHEVVGMSRTQPGPVPRSARWVSADITDSDSVIRAMDGCDTVAHCAWAVDAVHDDGLERRINVGGTENVLRAMEKTGATRIVFASSSTVYGPQAESSPLSEATPTRPHPDHTYGLNKQEVEQLLAVAPVDSIPIRVVPVLGRSIDNRVFALIAGPRLIGIRGKRQLWQVVHADDVGRFFALACETGPTGPVNLASDGVFTVEELARVLGKKMLDLPETATERVVRKAWDRKLSPVSPADLDFVSAQPILDNARAKESFGFEFGWNGLEVAEDTRLATRPTTAVGARTFPIPWRKPFMPSTLPADTPPLDGAELVPAGPAAWVGEFDTPMDPRFDTFTTTNLSEALPGPATALSLTTVADGLQAAVDAASDLVGLNGVAGLEAKTRFQATFGHRMYVSVVCGMAIGELSPGWDAESIADQFLGRHADEVDLADPATLPMDVPGNRRAALRAKAGLAIRTIGLAAGYSRDVDELVRQTDRLDRLVSDARQLSDVRLQVLGELARDLVIDSWALAGRAAVLAGGLNAQADAISGMERSVEHVGQELISGHGLAGVRALADAARCDPSLVELLASPEATLDEVRRRAPAFAAEVDHALARFGHRGPGECELANPTFADDPSLLLRAVAGVLAGPEVASPAASPSGWVPRRARPVVRRAAKVTAERERGRSRVVALIGILRRIARERGRRLHAASVLDHPDDVFHLTFDQLWAPPYDARQVVARRRSERERLASIRLPTAFSGRWEPLGTSELLDVGASISAVGAAQGSATGRVRILTADRLVDLEPGEVLVSTVTDVGYTPLFGIAAAVVTDVGGVMSHAAVVAREFGIPAVVDTANATAVLADGMMVEVDGKAGTVTRVG